MWNLNRTQGVGIGVAVFLGSSQFLRLQVAKVFWERRKVSPGNGKGKSGESCKGKLWNIGCAGTPKLHFCCSLGHHRLGGENTRKYPIWQGKHC